MAIHMRNGKQVGGSIEHAENLLYSNENSGLEAKNVQAAIDEVKNLAGNGGGGSNPNLLDNPFFTVNQRGFTSKTLSGSAEYFVDRWASSRSAITLNSDNSVNFSWNGTSGTNAWIEQWLEKELLVVGNTYTLSAIIDDKLFSATGVLTSSGGIRVSKLWDNNDNNKLSVGYNSTKDAWEIAIWTVSTTPHKIQKIKFELGSVSTLSLDSAPDYSLELIKCRTSKADTADEYANKTIAYNREKIVTGYDNFYMSDGVHDQRPIRVFDDGDGSTNSGAELVVTANGNTFIGAGESPFNLRKEFNETGVEDGESYSQTSEKLYITADSEIYMYVNAGTVANRKGIVIKSDGTLRPIIAGGGYLGTKDIPWASVYANKLYSAGNEVATKADFQAGVDQVYNKCVSAGSTPSSKALANVLTAIGKLSNMDILVPNLTGCFKGVIAYYGSLAAWPRGYQQFITVPKNGAVTYNRGDCSWGTAWENKIDGKSLGAYKWSGKYSLGSNSQITGGSSAGADIMYLNASGYKHLVIVIVV